MTSNPSEPQERWEVGDYYFGPERSWVVVCRTREGGDRIICDRVSQANAEHIVALHNAALARPEPAAGETGLLEEAVTLLKSQHIKHQTREDWARICWPHLNGEVPKGAEDNWREPREWCRVCRFLDAVQEESKSE